MTQTHEAPSVTNIATDEALRNDGEYRLRVWFCELHCLVTDRYIVSKGPIASIFGVEYVFVIWAQEGRGNGKMEKTTK
jgi:hypothetical protein